ncbi:Glycerol uptake protein 1 [Serendipita indica DSM 11827]|nr:Glycerol uptake protein 1 [Serendipita indica DSM 11827]
METILHYMYMVAIKDTKAWNGDSLMQLCMIGFWNLIIVWLKLLIPWRFFRLWALADGMEPTENMIRCMANNYTVAGFWRGWHRSYNQWLIRYIYVPLGGSSNVILATLVSFTFVALWHDLQLRLLVWGWLLTLFILPEMILGRVFNAKQYGGYWWYRHLRALGGVGNILMLMIANLVGFVMGLDGVQYLFGQLVGSWDGVGFLLVVVACLWIGVQFMLEYREEERRRGIYRKC